MKDKEGLVKILVIAILFATAGFYTAYIASENVRERTDDFLQQIVKNLEEGGR